MTPVFKPSAPALPIQTLALHEPTLTMSSRHEGAVGVSPLDQDKTLFLTVQIRESVVTRLNETQLRDFKQKIISDFESRVTSALGL
jgi:hypothetical protein